MPMHGKHGELCGVIVLFWICGMLLQSLCWCVCCTASGPHWAHVSSSTSSLSYYFGIKTHPFWLKSCLSRVVSQELSLTMAVHKPCAHNLRCLDVLSRDELLTCRRFASRSRTPPKSATTKTNDMATDLLHSPLLTSRPSNILRKARVMKQQNAKQRDKDKIVDLEKKLAAGPQYIVVEKTVEKIVEKIVEVPQFIPDEQPTCKNPRMYTHDELLEFFHHHSQAIRDDLAAENAEYAKSLRSQLGDQLRELRGINDELAASQLRELQRINDEYTSKVAALEDELFKTKNELDQLKMVDENKELRNALLNVVHLPSEQHGVVVGLTKSPKLNGSVVHCQKWHEDRLRWQVRTADGKDILLKDENILRQDFGDDDDSPSSRDNDSMS